jgi:hypothetical protein
MSTPQFRQDDAGGAPAFERTESMDGEQTARMACYGLGGGLHHH